MKQVRPSHELNSQHDPKCTIEYLSDQAEVKKIIAIRGVC